jgi:hypothetical protein
MSIPASEIVQVTPGVLSAGGNPLSLNAVFLTTNIKVPLGTVAQFATLEDVEDFFGPVSTEAGLAAVYFNGFNGCESLPSVIYFAQYNTAAANAYLRGGSLAGVTLAQLQLISGTLSVTVNGSPLSGSVNLAGATSFSNAATLIRDALDASAPFAVAVTWDAQVSRFFITSATTGPSSTIGYASGSAAAGLMLTEATGAVISPGADVATPAGILGAVKVITQNWASFMTTWEPDTDGKLAFAAWVQTQGQRFLYAAWDTDTGPTTGDDPTSFGAQVAAAAMDGVVAVYDPDGKKAALICGITASIDFEATNGRITYAFRAQSGLTADVTTATVAANLAANGYNFYADYATAADQFRFLSPGSIAGKWKWIDAYVNQIQFNNALQLAFMDYLANVRSVPYNAEGYSQLRTVALDPITAALNFGTIRPGVTMSNSQKAQVNSAAGANVSAALQNAGWFLKIGDASPTVRAARGSPPMTLWYLDGGSIQSIELSSVNVQ